MHEQQGGRLVSLRKMVSDMYIFDLQTFIWTKVEPKPDDPVPGPRYFHSADACEYPLRSLSLHSALVPTHISGYLGPWIVILSPLLI